ncbi:hypothetical protein FACS18949_00030 [Clostridia bacterium]|nr:hypothetical protein FACS18949_00030 [Clostridia bacterium]
MIRTSKRILSFLLVFALFAGISSTIAPSVAYAAEQARVSYEETVYQSLLEQFGGDAETARHTLDIMRQAGLLESGNSFYKTAKIRLNGKLLTLDEVRARIAGGEDLTQTVYVNNYPLPLADLKQIIEIEDFIEYVRINYIENDIEMTDVHESYYDNLLTALEMGQVQMSAAGIESAPAPDWFSENEGKISAGDYKIQISDAGYNYEYPTSGSSPFVWNAFDYWRSNEIEFELIHTVNGGKVESAPYPISFDWRLQSGTAKAGVHFTAASGTVIFEPGDIRKRISISLAPKVSPIILDNAENIAGTIRGDWRFSGERSFYLQSYNFRNAEPMAGMAQRRIAVRQSTVKNLSHMFDAQPYYDYSYVIGSSEGYGTQYIDSEAMYSELRLRFQPPNVTLATARQNYFTGVDYIGSDSATMAYKNKVYAETTITSYLAGVTNLYGTDAQQYEQRQTMDQNIINLIYIADGWLEYERPVRYYLDHAQQVTVDATLQFSINFNNETTKAYGTPKAFTQLTTQTLTFTQEMAADILKWVLKYKTANPTATWNDALSKIKIIITQKNSKTPAIVSDGTEGTPAIIIDADPEYWVYPWGAADEAKEPIPAADWAQDVDRQLLWKRPDVANTKVEEMIARWEASCGGNRNSRLKRNIIKRFYFEYGNSLAAIAAEEGRPKDFVEKMHIWALKELSALIFGVDGLLKVGGAMYMLRIDTFRPLWREAQSPPED